MDFTKEINLGFIFDPQDRQTSYWGDEDQVYYGLKHIKQADIETFRFYFGGFAKDKKYCYCVGRKLKDANPQTFRALNLTYYKDDKYVWTIGGKIKDADAETFKICDEGFVKIINHYIPSGFGKDKEKVFYYDYDGIPNWVRKANPSTFVSLQDGNFGKDNDFVFYGRAVIPNAKVKYWNKIGGLYSKDDSKVFFMNMLVRIADYETFEVTRSEGINLAKDKNNFYWNENVINQEKYDDLYQSYPNLKSKNKKII